MRPGRFTELFFLDEATALAAGHRPCALCRRDDYTRFAAFWRELHGDIGAEAIDVRLHDERVEPMTRGHRLHETALDDVPDGAFVLHDDAPHLVLGQRLLSWSPEGYTSSVARPCEERAILITPPSHAALLRVGWESSLPLVHPSTQAI